MWGEWTHYYCPNTGRIIGTSDDKAICHCGRPNPEVPAGVRPLERVDGAMNLHVAAYLEEATWEEYLDQVAKDKEGLKEKRTSCWLF